MFNDSIFDAQNIELLRKKISQANNVVICVHVSPDGDAVGSATGLAAYLRQKGKNVTIIFPNQMPDFLKVVPSSHDHLRYDRSPEASDLMIKAADLIFCLDFNTASRTAEMEQSLRQSQAPKVLIDHHLEPDIETVLTVSHPEASSTSELVFRLVWQMGAFEELQKAFAVPLYTGMMTDTGGFTYNSSDPDIYFIISQLLTKRINKDKIYRNVYNNFSENRLRLMGYVMYEKLVVDQERHASYFTLTRDDLRRFHYIKGDSEGLVNMPLQMRGHRLSISLREDTERERMVWVSLRSVDQFPCNEMAARFFNGGGHLNASGGRLYCSIDEAVDIVKQALEAFDGLLK